MDNDQMALRSMIKARLKSPSEFVSPDIRPLKRPGAETTSNVFRLRDFDVRDQTRQKFQATKRIKKTHENRT